MNPAYITTPAEEIEEELEAALPVEKRDQSVWELPEWKPTSWTPSRAGAEAHLSILTHGLHC